MKILPRKTHSKLQPLEPIFGERKKIGALRKKYFKSLESVKIKSFSEALSERIKKVKLHIMLKLIALNDPNVTMQVYLGKAQDWCAVQLLAVLKPTMKKHPPANHPLTTREKSVFKLPSGRIVNTFCRSKRNRFFTSAFRIQNKKKQRKNPLEFQQPAAKTIKLLLVKRKHVRG